MGQDNAECFIEAVLNAAGDDDIADALLCIQSSFKKHEAGENVCGVPKLIETFGDKRGKKIAEWMGYKEAKPGKSQALTVVQMGGEISAFDEHPTDLGNSRVLVRLNEGDIRYCHAFKAWFIWTGTYWRRDDNGEVMRRAAGAVHFMLSSAIALDHEDPQRGPRIGWALASERRQRLSDMKALAQDDERAVLDYRLLDADPLLIGVLNGVVDLRTGEFREGRREDFITKRANVNYEPDAKCLNWLKFQEKICGAHPGLIDYKQRAFGLTLSGEVPEILWICHGSGSNGKTTELETISDILGDYAHASDASILIAEKNQGGATPEIVALKGKRAVFVNETGQNDWLNEARVKYISATDTMSGRNLFEGIVNWKPTHKPFLRTNQSYAGNWVTG